MVKVIKKKDPQQPKKIKVFAGILLLVKPTGEVVGRLIENLQEIDLTDYEFAIYLTEKDES